MKLFKISFLYILLFFTLLFSFLFLDGSSKKQIAFSKNTFSDYPIKNSKVSTLPLPTSLPLAEYEEQLYAFIFNRDYDTKLNWNVDKYIRDTGPWVNGKYYGTHPAVRIFYSPEVMYWLTGDASYWPQGNVQDTDPRTGDIADGAIIVKEMFTAPAVRWEGKTEKEIVASLHEKSSPGWTVMVKDSKGSRDGWFWASVFVNASLLPKVVTYEPPDSGKYNLAYPNSGFGQGCLRCHASAEKEFTFSAIRNIKGFSGDPVTFFVDDSWRDLPAAELPYVSEHQVYMADEESVTLPTPDLNEEFIQVFNMMQPVALHDVQKFPSESWDRVVAGPDGAEQFITSDQCMMCHSGGANYYGGYGNVMFLQTGPNEGDGLNVSPYGEWRWSPMGLAGRDPIFHAQLESEISILKKEFPDSTAEFFGHQTVNTCLLCHGAMGKRQYDIHQGVGDEYWREEATFKREWFFLTGENDPLDTTVAKFGGLGRDGISCAVCHHIEQEYEDFTDFIENNITGQFKMGPADLIYGPFPDSTIAPYAMENTFKIGPKHNEYIKSSRLCGSCHTINLPVVDYPLDNPPDLPVKVTPDLELNKPDKNPNFAPFMHKIEQATYLEWLNSRFQNEFPETTKKGWKSCQDCHMPGGYVASDSSIVIDTLKTKIAYIEDQSYPEADNRADLELITVRFREEGYSRHRLQGLNIFLAEMFQQFNDILGVRLTDYETGTKGLDFAIDNFVQQAKQRTATLRINNFTIENNELSADVKITNLTGHRYPSGVGFRRAFVEFLVIDNSSGRKQILWGSGRTNGVGVIVDSVGNILPTEFLTEYVENGDTLQHYQPHWQTITSQSQVQIYEELSKNAKARFTTSFTHRDYEMKDNRLVAEGWTKEGPSDKIPQAFLEATYPGHVAMKDPNYTDGSGCDIVTYKVALPAGTNSANISVKATLYTQEWAPYYLMQRFSNVPEGPEGNARRRLYYLASNLQTENTAIEDWKLPIASYEAKLK